MLVYGTRLWFEASVPFEEPASVVARWLSRKVGRQLSPGPLMAGVERTFEGAHRVRSVSGIDQYPKILAINYAHPDAIVSGRQWVTEVGLRQESASSPVECTILLNTDEISTRVSEPVKASRPNLVTELVRRCRLDSRTQGVSHRLLDDRFADAFRKSVLDPARSHSLVVLSPDPNGDYLADPTQLSSMLLGLADIVTIPSSADTFWLARVVGKDFIPYRGAVRVIYPVGRRIEAGPPPTKVFKPEDAEALRTDGKKLQDEIFSLIVHRSNLSLSRAHISLQLAKETRLRRELAHRRAEAAKSGDLLGDIQILEEYAAKLEEEKANQDGAIESLEKLIDSQEDRERKLSFDIESLKQRLEDAGKASRAVGPADGENEAVAAAIQAAIEKEPTPEQSLEILEYLFPERVAILPDAWRSARDSQQFRHGAKLYELLHLLLVDYWSALCAGTPDGEARKVFGNSYAAQESDGVAKNAGARARRTFQYGSQEVEMMKHLKIGVKESKAETIRVHFEWFPDERRIVIGHCGAHLSFK